MTANALPLQAATQESAYAVKVRRIEFDFPEDIPEFWFADDPVRTVLFSTLSGGFPEGERFFIDSVRHFQDQVKDPELRLAIRAFIGQEAHHGKQHDRLNQFLQARGYDVDRIERNVGKLMQIFRKTLSPERQLAHTAAIEHFTAMLAEQYLLDPAELAGIHPALAGLIAWHAVEEAEHKAVAFDVYKATVDDEWVRLSQMAIGTVLFLGISTVDFLRMMRHSGRMGDLKMWGRSVQHFWGSKGVFRKMIPAYFSYYRRDFHPNEVDSRAQQQAVKEQYLGQYA